MAVAATASAMAENLKAQSAATAVSYNLFHGSVERPGGTSTPTRLPAALRIVEAITQPQTIEDALTPGVHAFGSPATGKVAEDKDHNEAAPDTAGDLTGAHLGSMNTDELKSMQSQISAALRARGEPSAGGTGELEPTMGGKDDARKFDKEYQEMVKQQAQVAEGVERGGMAGYPSQAHLPDGGGPALCPATQQLKQQALQQHDNVRANPTAQQSTSPPSIVTLRRKTRFTSPNTKGAISNLAQEVDKHKLNSYQVNGINAKESALTQSTLDGHKQEMDMLKRMIHE